MKLETIDYQKIEYPMKTLLMGNEDTWSGLLAVIEDLTDEQLKFKSTENPNQRSIAEIIKHVPETQYGFYTLILVLEKPGEVVFDKPQTVEEAKKMLADAYQKTVSTWLKITKEQLERKFTTEWGQELTGELALFQSITHTHYHLSEICFLRGCGGFPTKAMG